MESSSVKLLDRQFSIASKKFSFEKILLITILLIAAFLRLYRIGDYMEFLGDQGRDVVIVGQFLKKGDLMFIGPQTSIGNMYLGPWYYYLISPALLLANFSPVGPAVTVSLIGLATVWLIWWTGKEFFNRKIALLAALFLAISPVVVYYSIFSWNPNVMPFFTLFSIWLTWRIWQKNQFKKIPWLAFCLSMVLNSHYLGLLLFPLVGVFWLLALVKNWKKETKALFIKYSLIGLFVFLLLMSPLLLFDLKHQFANSKAMWTFFTIRQTTVNLKAYKGFLTLPKIVNQLLSNLFLKKDFWQLFYWFMPLALFSFLKARKSRSFWFIFAWLIFGLLGLSNYKQHVYAHYFGFLWPVAILLLAFLIDKLFWLISLTLSAGLIWLALINWHGWRPPNFQVRRAKEVSQFIIDQSQGEKFSLALIAEMNYDPPYRYFLNMANAPLVDLHQEITDQLFVICEPWGKVDCNPVGHPLWSIAAFGWAEIDQEWEVEGVKIFKLIHTQETGNSQPEI